MKFNNDGGAMTNRLMIIPCSYRIKEEDKIEGYYDRFDNERDAIFNWFLEGLKRLLKNKWRFTTPKAIIKATEEFDRNSNDLKYWLLDNIEKTDNMEDKIYIPHLCNSYTNYLTLEVNDKKANNYGLKYFRSDLKDLLKGCYNFF